MCGAHVSGGVQAKKAIEDCIAIREGTGESEFQIFAVFLSQISHQFPIF